MSTNPAHGHITTAGEELSWRNSGWNNTQHLYALSPLITVVGANTLAVAADEDPSVTIDGLANDAERHFRVRAVRGTDTNGDWSDTAAAMPLYPTDYDKDDDGLIEIETLAQLNAVRWDMNGDGMVGGRA